jgi:hypothetical protein
MYHLPALERALVAGNSVAENCARNNDPGGKRTSRVPGLVAGAIDSSGAAFFYDGKKWVHVWISD